MMRRFLATRSCSRIGRRCRTAALQLRAGATAASRATQRWYSQGGGDGRRVSSDLFQPTPAIDLISEVPPIEVSGRVARCDGGDGALGHPAVYINLDDGVQPCGYCGLRFVRKDHHY